MVVCSKYINGKINTNMRWDTLDPLANRQMFFLESVIKQILTVDMHKNISWLLHIDDDEMLHFKSGDVNTFLRKVPLETVAIQMKTVEALCPTGDVEEKRCFRTDTFLNCNSHGIMGMCSSYYGGKHTYNGKQHCSIFHHKRLTNIILL